MRQRTFARCAAALAAAVVVLSAAGTAALAQTKSAPQPSKAPASKAETKAPAADPNAPEKEFTITLLNGAKVKMTVFPNPEWPGKVVRAEPGIPQNEVNLHIASLHSMWQIYGRQRGSFKVEDGTVATRENLGATIVIYKLPSGAKFCVFPIRDDKNKTFAGIKVWME